MPGTRAAVKTVREEGDCLQLRRRFRDRTSHDPRAASWWWARGLETREDAADLPHVALGHSQCVTDVTMAVAVDVADLGMNEGHHAACAHTDVILRRDERVTDVHHAVPVHVAAQERGGRGAGRG